MAVSRNLRIEKPADFLNHISHEKILLENCIALLRGGRAVYALRLRASGIVERPRVFRRRQRFGQERKRLRNRIRDVRSRRALIFPQWGGGIPRDALSCNPPVAPVKRRFRDFASAFVPPRRFPDAHGEVNFARPNPARAQNGPNECSALIWRTESPC